MSEELAILQDYLRFGPRHVMMTHIHIFDTRDHKGGGEGDLHEFLRGGLHEFLYGLVLWYQGKATGAVKSVQILGH